MRLQTQLDRFFMHRECPPTLSVRLQVSRIVYPTEVIYQEKYGIRLEGNALLQSEFLSFPVECRLINSQDLGGFREVGGWVQDFANAGLLQLLHGNQGAFVMRRRWRCIRS